MKKPPLLENVHRMLFYGDSLTDGSSYPDYVVNTLSRLYPDASFELLNAAVCGNTAADLRKRLHADVLQRKPHLVVMAIGTNDAWRDRRLNEFQDDVEYLLAKLHEHNIRCMVVLPSPFGQPAREEKFLAYLQVLKHLASKYEAPIADAHGLFLEWQKAGREVLGGDGVHHGKDGFEAMARAVLDAFGLRDAPLSLEVKPWPCLITDWEVSLPVDRDSAYDPSEASGWKPFDREKLISQQTWWNAPFAQRGAFMPFADASEKQVAYGRTWFEPPEAGNYEMQIGGSPAPQIAWINGEKVWEGKTPHGYHPDADRITVFLPKKRNEVVVVTNYMIFLGFHQAGNQENTK